jgi:hypothetical protein
VRPAERAALARAIALAAHAQPRQSEPRRRLRGARRRAHRGRGRHGTTARPARRGGGAGSGGCGSTWCHGRGHPGALCAPRAHPALHGRARGCGCRTGRDRPPGSAPAGRRWRRPARRRRGGRRGTSGRRAPLRQTVAPPRGLPHGRRTGPAPRDPEGGPDDRRRRSTTPRAGAGSPDRRHVARSTGGDPPWTVCWSAVGRCWRTTPAWTSVRCRPTDNLRAVVLDRRLRTPPTAQVVRPGTVLVTLAPGREPRIDPERTRTVGGRWLPPGCACSRCRGSPTVTACTCRQRWRPRGPRVGVPAGRAGAYAGGRAPACRARRPTGRCSPASSRSSVRSSTSTCTTGTPGCTSGAATCSRAPARRLDRGRRLLPDRHDPAGQRGFTADLMAETLRATALGDLEVGTPVNLERAMRADARFGGHLVQGHVDGVGDVVDRDELPGTVFLTSTRPRRWPATSSRRAPSRSPGSASPSSTCPRRRAAPSVIGLIPHTLEVTTLGGWALATGSTSRPT